MAIVSPCHSAAPARPQTRPARIEPHYPFNPWLSVVIRGVKLTPVPRSTQIAVLFRVFRGSIASPFPLCSEVSIRGFKYNHQTTLAPAQVELRPPPKKHPRPSIRTNSRPLPCVPCPPSFKKTPNCTRFSSDGNLPTHSIRSTVARNAGGSSRGGQFKNAAEIHRFPDRGRRRRLI